MRRAFTLQLQARAGIVKLPAVANPLPDVVQDMLNGHRLHCPGCGEQPMVTHAKVRQLRQVGIYGRTIGRVDTGSERATIEATCDRCMVEIEYELMPNGEPIMLRTQWAP